jgi:hypothetical protein
MKKQNLKAKLYLTKKIIASLEARNLLGGTAGSNDPEPLTVKNKTLCPVETCTCTDAVVANCKPIEI